MRMFGVIALIIGLGLIYVGYHQHKHPLDVTSRDLVNSVPACTCK